MASISLNSAAKLAFEAWVAETDIDLVQINGQRKFGGPPPGWKGPPPLIGSEVFIGKLPQDLYEDKLIPLFQSAGKLYEFRLMMTFSGENRGFAYAKYANRWYAQCAIAMLNGREVRDGCPIVVCRSTEKNELCVGGIPWGRRRAEVLEVLKELTAGVSDLSLHISTNQKKLAVFAVVKYESHRAAAMAKKRLVEGGIELWGQPIDVDWVKPDGKQRGQQLLLPSDSQPSPLAPAWQLVTRGFYLPSTGRARCSEPNLSADISQSLLPLGERDGKTQRLYAEEVPGPFNPSFDVVRLLNAYCLEKQLGRPIYSVQPLGSDKLRFLFKVFLPGLAAYFSGVVNLTPEDLALGQDVPKREAARQVLSYLGHSVDFAGFNPPNTSSLESQI